MSRAIRLRHLNLGSCNGCDIELLEALRQSPEVELVSDAKEADLLVLTGAMTPENAARIDLESFDPSLAVILLGPCATTQGAFSPSSRALPHNFGSEEGRTVVSVYGCPPRPEAILAAVREVAGREGWGS